MSVRQVLLADLRANRGHPKEQLILTSLRIAQGSRRIPILGKACYLMHRFWTEMIYGIELRPETHVGAGLRLFHGYGAVINTSVWIGENVKLHQGVTIGARHTGGPNPVVLDGSDIGAGAIILGNVTVGPDAVVGAGAVVLRDVPPGHVAVGNPARLIQRGAATGPQ